ncbi:MAG: flavin reductase [Thermoleophilia bacterium]|nr:flavin reductase [Thermoleophilia bacterium]
MTDAAHPSNEPMRSIDPADSDPQATYYLLNSVVVPRPIAWVSTLAADGTANLAPHSFCTVAGTQPPTLAFTSIGEKHTVANVRATGDFVFHVVDYAITERMNITAANAPADVSEFELAGLEQTASAKVRSPRVVGAPVAMECVLDRIIDVGHSRMVLGTVVQLHIAERLFDERDRVDPGRLDAVARMGGATYATTRDRFDLTRPSYDDLRVDPATAAD